MDIFSPCQEIEYEKTEKGLILAVYHGMEESVWLPDEIDGEPVVEIGPYAFANRADIIEIRLPAGIREIGRYAFYRCRNLRKLILADKILDIGGGALTGCRGIREVEIYFQDGERSALKSILDEVCFEVHARLYMGEQVADVLFPEHYEEAVEDTPARQLYTQHHGAGGDYRQCFYNRELDYRKYDDLFYRTIAEDTVDTALKMAFGRLRYPYRLTDEAKERYQIYLKEHLVELYELFILEEAMEYLRFLTEEKYVSEEALQAGIACAQVNGKTEVLSFLMDEKRKHFPKKRKTFDL